MMLRIFRLSGFSLLLAALSAYGQAENEPEEVAPGDDDEAFAIPSAEFPNLASDAGFDLASPDFAGNPMSSLLGKWPDDLVMAPIPGYSPQLGWTLSLAGGYFLNSAGQDEEPETPPSVVGAAAMAAENGSYAYGIGTYLHLLDDRIRVKAAAGFVDIRYRFYGIGNDRGNLGIGLDVLQEAPMFLVSAMHRVGSSVYLGLGYVGGTVDSKLRVNLDSPPPFFDPSIELDIGAVSIPFQFDTRDHEQFPRSGWLVDATAMIYRDRFGGDFDTETLKLTVNNYRPFRDGDVLALRAVARATSANAPFFLLSTFGGSKDLRGYPAGRYRDRMMYALQAEYRWQFNDRWIFTGFTGFGEVAETFADFGNDYLPAAGVGARFVLSAKHRISLSADFAVGEEDREFYFGINEAF